MSITATIAVIAILAAVVIGHLLGDRQSKGRTGGRTGLIIAIAIAVVVFGIAGWDHITSLFEVVRVALHLHK